MSKNKKPRRKFNPNKHARYFAFSGLTDVTEKFIYEKFLSLQLKAEMKLLNGNCTTDEVADLMDFLQWGKIAVATRKFYEDKDRINAQKILIEASDALNQVMIRGIDSDHYVCTGNEINLIRDGMSIVGPLMETSIKEMPHRTEKEWNLMIRYSRGKEGREVDIAQLIADLERV